MTIQDTIQETLEEHFFHGIWSPHSPFCTEHPGRDCQWRAECNCPAELPLAESYEEAEKVFAAHQSAMVTAALTKGGHVEWGSKMIGLTTPTYLWLYKDRAEAEAETARFPNHRKTVSRVVGPWEEAS